MKKSKKRTKIISICTALLYFVLIVCICGSGFYLFHNLYFTSFFVSGGSMYPTLNNNNKDSHSDLASGGDVVDFGIMDTSSLAKKKIKNFDIITTYYPWQPSDYKNGNYVRGQEPDGYNPSFKIKRVLAIPGDTLEIINSIIYINDIAYDDEAYINEKGVEVVKKLPFSREFDSRPKTSFNLAKFTLEEGRYWVQGDHWSNSSDCLTLSNLSSSYDRKGIYYENIAGVVLAIEGTGTIKKLYKCPKCDKEFSSYGICPNCSTSLVGFDELVDKHYHFPKFML